jgi:quercetin dioxygenase-like cupin family protein
MTDRNPEPGDVIDVLTPKATKISTRVLIKTNEFEVFRLDVPAGTTTPIHKTHGTIIVQCIDGLVVFDAVGETRELLPGQLVYLPPNEPHAARANEDAALLVTVIFSKT